MRKAILVIVATFCMAMFNSCDEAEFTTVERLQTRQTKVIRH